MSQWKNRIVGRGEEAPDQLQPNPLNANKIHPFLQQDSLLAVLEEVGLVQDVIVNRRTGYLVDGHLRVWMALRHQQPTVPVQYIDVTPEEEEAIIATYDPIAALAETDKEKYAELLERASADNPLMAQALRNLAERFDVLEAMEAKLQAVLPPGREVRDSRKGIGLGYERLFLLGLSIPMTLAEGEQWDARLFEYRELNGGSLKGFFRQLLAAWIAENPVPDVLPEPELEYDEAAEGDDDGEEPAYGEEDEA